MHGYERAAVSSSTSSRREPPSMPRLASHPDGRNFYGEGPPNLRLRAAPLSRAAHAPSPARGLKNVVLLASIMDSDCFMSRKRNHVSRLMLGGGRGNIEITLTPEHYLAEIVTVHVYCVPFNHFSAHQKAHLSRGRGP